MQQHLLHHLIFNLREKELYREKGKKAYERIRQREANANRSVVDSLRLRATDAELIKDRLLFLNGGQCGARENPMALVFSVRKMDCKGNRQK